MYVAIAQNQPSRDCEFGENIEALSSYWEHWAWGPYSNEKDWKGDSEYLMETGTLQSVSIFAFILV